MRILITGSSGMVGKNLLENGVILHHDLLLPSSKELNLLNTKNINNYFCDNKLDVIIHAAGKVGGIQANITNPVDFFIENLDMGKNLILAAKKCGINKILNIGSSCMYPRNAKNPLKEGYILTDKLEPTNEGYALAKISVLKLCEFISNENNSYQYKTIIPSNLYGRFDKFHPKHSHMLPAVIKKIHEAIINKKNKVDIWGEGSVRREFMYVGDFSNFIACAIERFDELPNIMNVGIGHDYTINEYYRIIADVIGYKGKFIYDNSKPVGMKKKLVDVSRLREFGWKHSTSLKEGIKLTYNYYLNEVLNH